MTAPNQTKARRAGIADVVFSGSLDRGRLSIAAIRICASEAEANRIADDEDKPTIWSATVWIEDHSASEV